MLPLPETSWERCCPRASKTAQGLVGPRAVLEAQWRHLLQEVEGKGGILTLLTGQSGCYASKINFHACWAASCTLCHGGIMYRLNPRLPPGWTASLTLCHDGIIYRVKPRCRPAGRVASWNSVYTLCHGILEKMPPCLKEQKSSNQLIM